MVREDGTFDKGLGGGGEGGAARRRSAPAVERRASEFNATSLKGRSLF